MRMRVGRARAAAAVASAAQIAALLVGTGGASASPTTYRAPVGTVCRGVLAGCGALLVNSPSGLLALQPKAALAGAPVLVQSPGPGQPLQDWTPQVLGTMAGLPLPERHALGITRYDLRTYGADNVLRLELTPDGRRTGLCAEATALVLVLGRCQGLHTQRPASRAFIQTAARIQTAAPRLAARPSAAIPGTAVPVGGALLLVAQARVPGRHLALRGGSQAGSQVRLARRSPGDAEVWQVSAVQQAAPMVTGVSPQVFADAGGTSVQITGTGFAGVSRVTFGSIPAPAFTITSNTSMTAISPPVPPGQAPDFTHLTVTGPGGTSTQTTADAFIQEDAQIDETCAGGDGTLVLYAVPDPLGAPTTATLSDTSLPEHAAPASTLTDEPATDGTPGWRQSTTPLVVPFGDTDSYTITAANGAMTWTNVPIAIGGVGNCGLTVWRG